MPWEYPVGVDVYLYLFLAFLVDGLQWLTSCPGHFIPGETDPKYPSNERMNWPQSWSGYFEEEKNLVPGENGIPECSAHRLFTSLCYRSSCNIFYTIINVLICNNHNSDLAVQHKWHTLYFSSVARLSFGTLVSNRPLEPAMVVDKCRALVR